MSLSYGALGKQNKKTIANSLGKACKEYIDDLKKKLDDFLKETQTFWKTKTKVGQIGNQITTTIDAKNKKKVD